MTEPHSPGPTAAADRLWSVTRGADLTVRQWGDECLVHHALSNNTHRLSAWAAEVLFELAEAGPASQAVLAERLAMAPTDIDLALTTLSRLDLVCPC